MLKGAEMQKEKPTTQFWTILATVNILALMYPVNLLHSAEGTDDKPFAAITLIGVVFLLMMIDVVSILIANVFSDSGM